MGIVYGGGEEFMKFQTVCAVAVLAFATSENP